MTGVRKRLHGETTSRASTDAPDDDRKSLLSGAVLGAPRTPVLSEHVLAHFFRELVGTFVCNYLCMCVIYSSTKAGSEFLAAAQQKFDPLANPLGMAVLPGEDPKNPAGVTGPWGSGWPVAMLELKGNIPMLFVVVGIAGSFACGLWVAPHAQVNPIFTLAMAGYGWKPLHLVPWCMVGQMLGGILACAMVYGHTHMIGDQPKDLLHSAVYMGLPPPDDLDNGAYFWVNALQTALMALVVVPTFASGSVPLIAIPPIVSIIILGFVSAGQGYSVANNWAMYHSGLFFCSMAGWPVGDIWKAHNKVVWVNTIAPLVGIVIGVAFLRLYMWINYSPHSPLYVQQHNDDDDEDDHA